nr:Protein Y7A9D.1 [Haemonchus contortus]
MHRETRPTVTVSTSGRIRKSSTERKEKLKVESTLRRLVGSDESTSQLELVLSAIRYIRELQSQLENDKENDVPDTVQDSLQDLFAQCSVGKTATA